MKTYSNISFKRSRHCGFSLVEMLIVVAILAIMSAIVLNSFSQGQRSTIIETVNRRNAQAFATIASCAQLSGVDPVTGTDVQATMRQIVNGITPTAGPMSGKAFRIAGLSDDDIAGAAYYLRIANGQLFYLADQPMKPY
jgi:prepilin-type N-terminal cleavage/methylation domain-containing protein